MISKDLKMILRRSVGVACKDKPRILLINPFGIGDVLHTTPVVRALKNKYPQSFIGFWCNNRAKDLLKNNPCIDTIFSFSRGDFKKIFKQSKLEGIKKAIGLFLWFKKNNYDLCLDFSLDHRYGLLSWLWGVKKRIGFDYRNRGKFLTDKIFLQSYANKHVVEYYLELLKPLGIKSEVYNLEFFASEASAGIINKLFALCGLKESDKIIGIFPGGGASWGKEAVSRHWSAMKFAKLIEMIVENLKVKVLLLGDESEKQLTDAVKGQIKNKPVDLVGKVELEDMPALLSRLELVVSNDGGPLHMAVASGTRTVSIFGPVDDLVYGAYPANKNNLTIKSNIACRPCYRNFKLPVCQNDGACLKSLSVEAVFGAISEFLKKER